MPQVFNVVKLFILCEGIDIFTNLASCFSNCERLDVDNESAVLKISFSAFNEKERAILILKDAGYFKIFEDCWVLRENHSKSLGPKVQTFFDAIYLEYDQLIQKQWNVSCYEFLFNSTPHVVSKNIKVLDFGCGTGIITATEFFSRCELVVGFDFCENMLLEAKNKGLITLTQDEFDKQDEKYFDLVISSYVLHYGISEQAFLKLIRLLKPQGRFSANLHKNIKISQYMEFCERLDERDFMYNLNSSPFGSVVTIERL